MQTIPKAEQLNAAICKYISASDAKTASLKINCKLSAFPALLPPPRPHSPTPSLISYNRLNFKGDLQPQQLRFKSGMAARSIAVIFINYLSHPESKVMF